MYNFKKAYNGKNAARKRRNTFKAVKKGIKYAKAGYKMANKVARLAAMINAEKKRNVRAYTGTVGQLDANASGYYVNDITPIVSQGTTSITRNGNSIRLHSSVIKLQLIHQQNANIAMKLQMLIIKPNAQTQDPNTLVNQIYSLNPFVYLTASTTPCIIDINSSFNPDFYRNFTIVYKRSIYVPEDSYSGINNAKTVSIPLRWKNHHVRYSADGSTNIASGQLICLILADSGNKNDNTASTNLNIPSQAALSGCKCNFYIQHYFYDN